MAGAAQLIARLNARAVPSVPSRNHQPQGANRGEYRQDPKGWKGSRDLPFREIQGNQGNQPAQLAQTERPHFIRTAATASPAWLAARDQYLNHVMTCRACYAPAGRHCQAGADLRASYDRTPWS